MIKHMGTVPLESARLELRGLTADLAETVWRNWTGDAQVARFMPWNAHPDPAATAEWLRQCEEKQKSPQFYDWGIFLKETGEPIGTIGVNFEEDGGEPGEVGYAIGRAFWGKGYTSEALTCMVEFLAGQVGACHLIGKQCVENGASGAVMRRVGFREVGSGSYESFDGARVFPSRVFSLERQVKPISE